VVGVRDVPPPTARFITALLDGFVGAGTQRRLWEPRELAADQPCLLCGGSVSGILTDAHAHEEMDRMAADVCALLPKVSSRSWCSGSISAAIPRAVAARIGGGAA
jgi:hypothetical protein